MSIEEQVIVIKEEPKSVVVVEEVPASVVVIQDEKQRIEVFSGMRGPSGRDAYVFYGTGDPPDPENIPNGALYIQYID